MRLVSGVNDRSPSSHHFCCVYCGSTSNLCDDFSVNYDNRTWYRILGEEHMPGTLVLVAWIAAMSRPRGLLHCSVLPVHKYEYQYEVQVCTSCFQQCKVECSCTAVYQVCMCSCIRRRWRVRISTEREREGFRVRLTMYLVPGTAAALHADPGENILLIRTWYLV